MGKTKDKSEELAEKAKKTTTKKSNSTTKKAGSKTSTAKTKKSTSTASKKASTKTSSSKTTESKAKSTTKKTSTAKSTSTRTKKSKKDVEETKEINEIENVDIEKLDKELESIKDDSKETPSNETSIPAISNLSDFESRIKKSQKDFDKIYTKAPANKEVVGTNNVLSSSTISQKRQKKISFKNFIYNTIIIVCLALIIYSSYNIFIWHQNNKENNALIEKVTSETPISEIKTISISDDIQIEKKSYDFNNLLIENPDTIGWISVPNTEINYPVVKGNDNEFYLNHAFDKTYNAAGWIYADYRNNGNSSDKNLIIYGHNRLNNNMFGTLENTLEPSWISDETNHYINYASLSDSSIYQIFSTILCKSEDSVQYLKTDFSSDEEYLDYIKNIKNQSTTNYDITLNETDRIITLYTCHGLNNERLIVFGKLVEEKKDETKKQ